MSVHIDLANSDSEENAASQSFPKKTDVSPNGQRAVFKKTDFAPSIFVPNEDKLREPMFKDQQQSLQHHLARRNAGRDIPDNNNINNDNNSGSHWINTKKIRNDFNADEEFFKDLKASNNNTLQNAQNSNNLRNANHFHVHLADQLPSLTEEQKYIVKQVLSGKSIFFTGCAGTGKSTLLRYLIHILPPESTFVTAATGLIHNYDANMLGVAALNIRGMTLHAFAGIGLGTQSKEELVDMIFNDFLHKNWWQKVGVLIIDEISMIEAGLFEKLEYIARQLRKSNRPFGGIQLVCSGDFFQLPPISKTDEAEARYCFESEKWSQCIEQTIELTQVFRQNDISFISMLNEIRHGICTQETQVVLESLADNKFGVIDNLKTDWNNPDQAHIITVNDIESTRLYPQNREVDDLNNSKLALIKAKGKLYKAKDKGKSPFLENLQSSCPVPGDLKLKVGAQVILTRNLNKRGRKPEEISLIFRPGEEITVEPLKWSIEVFGVEMASREQVPLKLAWAISIHKCQGSTLTRVEISLKNVFEWGQAYVALSRVSSLEGLRVLDFSPKSIKANPKVIDYYHRHVRKVSSSAFLGHSPDKPGNNTKVDIYSITLDNADSSAKYPLSPPKGSVKKDKSSDDASSLGEAEFKIAYAPSNRSTCKQCNKIIEKDALRVGKMVKSKSFDGYFPMWYHMNCFLVKKEQTPQYYNLFSTRQLEGFSDLTPDDQTKVIQRLSLKKEAPIAASIPKTVSPQQFMNNITKAPELQTTVIVKNQNNTTHVQQYDDSTFQKYCHDANAKDYDSMDEGNSEMADADSQHFSLDTDLRHSGNNNNNDMPPLFDMDDDTLFNAIDLDQICSQASTSKLSPEKKVQKKPEQSTPPPLIPVKTEPTSKSLSQQHFVTRAVQPQNDFKTPSPINFNNKTKTTKEAPPKELSVVEREREEQARKRREMQELQEEIIRKKRLVEKALNEPPSITELLKQIDSIPPKQDSESTQPISTQEDSEMNDTKVNKKRNKSLITASDGSETTQSQPSVTVNNKPQPVPANPSPVPTNQLNFFNLYRQTQQTTNFEQLLKQVKKDMASGSSTTSDKKSTSSKKSPKKKMSKHNDENSELEEMEYKKQPLELSSQDDLSDFAAAKESLETTTKQTKKQLSSQNLLNSDNHQTQLMDLDAIPALEDITPPVTPKKKKATPKSKTKTKPKPKEKPKQEEKKKSTRSRRKKKDEPPPEKSNSIDLLDLE